MLSIIIVHWNTRDELRKCLASIRSHPPDREYEVLVVDNASDDGSAAMVRAEFPECRLFAEDRNWGYAKGNNIGFASAQGELLLTLNPDTEFFDDTLEQACRKLEELADRPGVPRLSLSTSTSPPPPRHIGVLAPKLIGPDGEVQASVRGFPSLIGILGAWTGLDRWFPRSALGSYRLRAFDYELEQLAPQPMGTFLLFRRSDLEKAAVPTRPLDEDFPIFFNEVDLLKRLHDAGVVCVYCPELSVRHLHGASTRQRPKKMIWESHMSLVRYFRKHLAGPARLALPLIAAMAWLAALVRARGYDRGFGTLD